MGRPLGEWVLALDGALPDGGLPNRALIGGKAWSVARMRALGLPVPPAFVITTRACAAHLAGAGPEGLEDGIDAGLAWLEAETGRRFGAGPLPLLVSVRSGAPVSMPGMMDTVLNLGITETTEAALAAESGQPGFARDTRRRFLELYAGIVLRAGGIALDPAAEPDTWLGQIEAAAGTRPPDTARDQLALAVTAVFESWNGRRAKRYRKHHGIRDDLGTAVTVQAMVFGNLDGNSGTGVLFSRNPLTGEDAPFGEFLPAAQGEDVVSGKFTPLPLSEMEARMPAQHDALLKAAALLERENGDVQDIEFTVQKGALHLLQTRAAKRAPRAAVRFAVEMAEAGLIDEATALSRVSPEQTRILLRPRLAEGAAEAAGILASGEGACPGIGRGIVVTDPDEAERRAADGVVLVRPTTSPDDVHGMIAARAIVTEMGGSTSHAAVVSRALGTPCVVGCGAGTLAALAGREVTVDGEAGRVLAGALPMVTPMEADDPALRRLLGWAEARSPLKVVLPAEAPDGTVDLGALEGGEDPESLPALLEGVTAATGGALASDAGVRAARAAGVRVIAADPRLPVLLAVLHAEGADPDAETLAAQAAD